MDNKAVDEKMQNKMALESLVGSAGMRVFKADLNDLVLYADSEIVANKKGHITSEKLSKLNYDLGRKQGLEMVLNVLQGYEDELVDGRR